MTATPARDAGSAAGTGGLAIKVVDNRPVGGHAHVQIGYSGGQRFNFTADEAREVARRLRQAAKQIEQGSR